MDVREDVTVARTLGFSYLVILLGLLKNPRYKDFLRL